MNIDTVGTLLFWYFMEFCAICETSCRTWLIGRSKPINENPENLNILIGNGPFKCVLTVVHTHTHTHTHTRGSLFLDLCGDNGLHPVKTWKHKEQKRARVAIRIMLKFYVTPSDEGGVSKQKLSRNYRVNYVCSKEICNYVGEQGICCF